MIFDKSNKSFYELEPGEVTEILHSKKPFIDLVKEKREVCLKRIEEEEL